MSRLGMFVCLILLWSAAPSIAQDRLALVIGNGDYRNIPGLANPANDADLMTRTLRAKGFRVTKVVEADRATMSAAVERFGRDLSAAPAGTLALFYFAGHGVRSGGFNYLLPLGVDIRAEGDIAGEAIAAEWVLDRIAVPGITSLTVLDACRNNPFDGRGPSEIPDLGDGLARMTAREDSVIAYATGPGQVALDGAGDNSPYTTALARAIRNPGLDVEAIFEQVRDDVVAETAGFQVPWERSSLGGAIYMLPDPPAGTVALPAGDPASQQSLHLAIAFRPGRWGGRGCRTLYRFDPIRLASAAETARRVTPVNGNNSLAFDVSLRRGDDGTELSIVPVSAGASGRPMTAPLHEIARGGEQVLYTRSRHPALLRCGAMTLYIDRDR